MPHTAASSKIRQRVIDGLFVDSDPTRRNGLKQSIQGRKAKTLRTVSSRTSVPNGLCSVASTPISPAVDR